MWIQNSTRSWKNETTKKRKNGKTGKKQEKRTSRKAKKAKNFGRVSRQINNFLVGNYGLRRAKRWKGMPSMSSERSGRDVSMFMIAANRVRELHKPQEDTASEPTT